MSAQEPSGDILAPQLQQYLSDVESSLGKSITIVDHRGRLYHQGVSMLGRRWQSHRKLQVCRLGFGPACVSHCRLQMNQRLINDPQPVVTHCWKGIREVAVALHHQGQHFGVMFVGSWRSERLPNHLFQEMSLSKQQRQLWEQAWTDLPVWRDHDHQSWYGVATLLAQAISSEIYQVIQGLPAYSNISHIHAEMQKFFQFQYHQPISLADLSVHLERSVSRTGALVREHYSKPFAAVLRSYRCNAAQHLLRDSQLRIKEIAHQVGYSEADYFSRCFQQETGMSPRAYRQQIAQGM